MKADANLNLKYWNWRGKNESGPANLRLQTWWWWKYKVERGSHAIYDFAVMRSLKFCGWATAAVTEGYGSFTIFVPHMEAPLKEFSTVCAVQLIHSRHPVLRL